MIRPRVLIIDDEPMIRMALRIMLRVNGYDPIEVSDAIHGLEVCRQAAPDAVLLDLMMPVMTGFDLLRALSPEFKASTPIVILSAVGDAAQEEQCYALGARALVVKPFRNQSVLSALNHFLDDPSGPLPDDVRLPP